MTRLQVIITLNEKGTLEISAPVKDNIIMVVGMIEMAKSAVIDMHKSAQGGGGGITIPPMPFAKLPEPKKI